MAFRDRLGGDRGREIGPMLALLNAAQMHLHGQTEIDLLLGCPLALYPPSVFEVVAPPILPVDSLANYIIC